MGFKHVIGSLRSHRRTRANVTLTAAREQCTGAERYKPPTLEEFPSTVIFLFCARNFAAPQNKS